MSRADTEQLVFLLEARTRELERGMQRATRSLDRNAGAMERRAAQASSRMQQSFAKAGAGIQTRFAGLSRGLAVGAVGALGVSGARDIARLADSYRGLQNQLRDAGRSGETLKQTWNALFDISQRQGASLGSLVGLYRDAANAGETLNATEADRLRFAEGVANALRIEGKSAQEAAGPLQQLGQLLAAGTVRAEEFNSVGEGMRPVLQAVADGLTEAGGSIGKLRTLMLDGKVSSEAFFRAFLAGSGQLAERADRAEGRVSGSFNRIGNAMLLLVGHLDEVTGASDNATVNLNAVAGVIEELPGYIDAAVGGLRTLDNWLRSVGSHSFWNDLRIALGGPEELTPEYLAQFGLKPNVMPQFGPPMPDHLKPGAPGSAENPIQLDVVNVETAADRATVSLNDFAAAADGAAEKVKLGRAPIETAREYAGLNERRDNDILSSLLKEGGQSIDPAKTAWCAAFVNAVLATNGLKDTGKLNARSFLDYGEKTDKPEQGDIVVLKRGSNQAQGHVGFFEGYDHKGNVRVLGGNQGDGAGGGVNTKSYNPADVLGYRRIPGVETGGAPGTNVADEIAKRQAREDSYNEIIASARQFTAEQQLERTALGMTEQAAARLRYEQQLLADAHRQQIEITPEVRAKFAELAAGMAEVEEATRKAATSQEDMQAMQGFLGNEVTGFFTSIITGSATVEQALQRVLASLAEAAIQAAFLGSGPLGGLFGGGAGILGSLFGFSKGGPVQAFASGGHVRGPGTGTSDSIPAMLSNGEFVVNAKATAKNRALLHAINSGSIAGFANGGLVGSAASAPVSAGGTSSITIAPVINMQAKGGEPAQNADLARQTSKAVENSVRAIVAQELRHAQRPGGVFRR